MAGSWDNPADFHVILALVSAMWSSPPLPILPSAGSEMFSCQFSLQLLSSLISIGKFSLSPTHWLSLFSTCYSTRTLTLQTWPALLLYCTAKSLKLATPQHFCLCPSAPRTKSSIQISGDCLFTTDMKWIPIEVWGTLSRDKMSSFNKYCPRSFYMPGHVPSTVGYIRKRNSPALTFYWGKRHTNT